MKYFLTTALLYFCCLAPIRAEASSSIESLEALRTTNFIGVEIIASQESTEELSSFGGHVFLRFVANDYYNDISVGVTMNNKQELRYRDIPAILAGGFQHSMHIDWFSDSFTDYLLTKNRKLNRFLIILKPDEILRLKERVIYHHENIDELGNYFLLFKNCLHFIYRIFEEANITKSNGSFYPGNLQNWVYENALSFFPLVSIEGKNKHIQWLESKYPALKNSNRDFNQWPSDFDEVLDASLAELNSSEQLLALDSFFLYYLLFPEELKELYFERFGLDRFAEISIEDQLSLGSTLRKTPSFDIAQLFSLSLQESIPEFPGLVYLLNKDKMTMRFGESIEESFHRYFTHETVRFPANRDYQSQNIFSTDKQTYVNRCPRVHCGNSSGNRVYLAIDEKIVPISTIKQRIQVFRGKNNIYFLDKEQNIQLGDYTNFHSLKLKD